MFKAGKYQTRFISDSDCKVNVEVVSCTRSMVNFIEDGVTKKAKIHTLNGDEPFFYPLGRYSMAPVIRPSHFVWA